MNQEILISNLTNPVLLFFLLGVVAAIVKSDLSIPESTSKFLSLYLLFSIGFKGGQELSHSGVTKEIAITLALAIMLACLVPLYTFFILKTKLKVSDAGAVAAAYGSVSAVTFISAASFLENINQPYGGHMVAAMALMEAPAIIIGVMLMEAPAIIIGVMLMRRYEKEKQGPSGIGHIVKESFTNSSVMMIMGSLVIGIVADSKQAEGIKPFTSDIFKGFLAVFLLEMGIIAAKRFKAFRSYGLFVTLFALLVPAVNGCLTVLLTHFFDMESGNRFMLAILAASASYIAVPAAMRLAAPKADPGLYIPMALGVSFPFNITVGIPLFWGMINSI